MTCFYMQSVSYFLEVVLKKNILQYLKGGKHKPFFKSFKTFFLTITFKNHSFSLKVTVMPGLKDI